MDSKSILDDKKMKAIELLISGENLMNVAKLVGVSRTSLYNWLDNVEFKAELDRRVQELRNQIDKKLLVNVEPLLDKLIKIALKSKSDKTSLDACIYAINRLAGTPTAKVEDVSNTEDSNNKTVDLEFIKNAIVNVEHKEIVEGEIIDDTGNK